MNCLLAMNAVIPGYIGNMSAYDPQDNACVPTLTSSFTLLVFLLTEQSRLGQKYCAFNQVFYKCASESKNFIVSLMLYTLHASMQESSSQKNIGKKTS